MIPLPVALGGVAALLAACALPVAGWTSAILWMGALLSGVYVIAEYQTRQRQVAQEAAAKRAQLLFESQGTFFLSSILMFLHYIALEVLMK